MRKTSKVRPFSMSVPMRLSVQKRFRRTRESWTLTSRQSMATKECEIERLRSQAAEKERAQEERIKRLEELVMQQSLHNQKLQSMLDSQLSQPPPVQVVETATLTRTAEPYVISAPIPACTVGSPATSVHPSLDPFPCRDSEPTIYRSSDVGRPVCWQYRRRS